MIDLSVLKDLVEAGGWTLFVVTIALIGAGAIRGWWVPGWIYRRSEERNAKIEAALVQVTDHLVKLTAVVRRRRADA